LGNSSLINRVGNMEQKIGGSSQVVNTESWVAENSANTESPFLKNSANTENWLMQDSWGGGGAGNQKKKGCFSKQKASSMVVPKGYFQDTKMLIAKDVSKRVGREKRRRRAGLLV
jgi:hypothetical protein